MPFSKVKTRFGIVGGGWRAEFFIRAANTLNFEFEKPIMYIRNPATAERLRQKYDVVITESLEDLIAQKPDYVVLSVPRSETLKLLDKLFDANIPVLCETPPSDSLENLNKVWKLTQEKKGRIQVAEQYFLQPYHSAVETVVKSGLLGEISNIKISMMHGYHGISVIRRLLGVGFENCTVRSRHYSFPTILNCNRSGMNTFGEVINPSRETATLEFSNGKVGFFDFDGEQYFSYIRHRSMCVQGMKGEIINNDVYYLNKDMIPVSTRLVRIDTGADSNLEGFSHRGIMLSENFVYRNPFEGARLNDDEIAVASCMRLMKKYVDTGIEFYPLKDALQDAYLALVMQKADEAPITTVSQSWCK